MIVVVTHCLFQLSTALSAEHCGSSALFASFVGSRTGRHWRSGVHVLSGHLSDHHDCSLSQCPHQQRSHERRRSLFYHQQSSRTRARRSHRSMLLLFLLGRMLFLHGLNRCAFLLLLLLLRLCFSFVVESLMFGPFFACFF